MRTWASSEKSSTLQPRSGFLSPVSSPVHKPATSKAKSSTPKLSSGAILKSPNLPLSPIPRRQNQLGTYGQHLLPPIIDTDSSILTPSQNPGKSSTLQPVPTPATPTAKSSTPNKLPSNRSPRLGIPQYQLGINGQPLIPPFIKIDRAKPTVQEQNEAVDAEMLALKKGIDATEMRYRKMKDDMASKAESQSHRATEPQSRISAVQMVLT